MKIEKITGPKKGKGMHSRKALLIVHRHPGGNVGISKRYLAKSRSHRSSQELNLTRDAAIELREMLDEVIKDHKVEEIIEG